MSGFVPPPLGLTLALAGKRHIDPRHVAEMTRDLTLTFDAIAEGLAAVTRAGPTRLTLITGLADGADQIAGALFLAGADGSVARELGAILPCPQDEFARNSPVEDLAAFERSARGCAFITVLRGGLPPPPPETLRTEAAMLARLKRGEAFAAQADALLRNADILVAIDDPEDDGEIGGTRQTFGRALNRGLPVILIHLGRSGVSLPRAGSSIEGGKSLRGQDARSALAALARETTTLDLPRTAQAGFDL
jgi:hypothetical protein